jgi:hypothetical protein
MPPPSILPKWLTKDSAIQDDELVPRPGEPRRPQGRVPVPPPMDMERTYRGLHVIVDPDTGRLHRDPRYIPRDQLVPIPPGFRDPDDPDPTTGRPPLLQGLPYGIPRDPIHRPAPTVVYHPPVSRTLEAAVPGVQLGRIVYNDLATRAARLLQEREHNRQVRAVEEVRAANPRTREAYDELRAMRARGNFNPPFPPMGTIGSQPRSVQVPDDELNADVRAAEARRQEALRRSRTPAARAQDALVRRRSRHVREER